MTQKEAMQISFLLGAVSSAINRLEWYASDYDSKEIESIAKELREARGEYNKSRSKKKK